MTFGGSWGPGPQAGGPPPFRGGPAPGGFRPGPGWGPPPGRPARRASGAATGCGAVGLGCGIIALVLTVIFAGIGLWAKTYAESSIEEAKRNQPTEPPAPIVYRIDERPGYREMRAHVEQTADKYLDMGERIWDVAPHGRRTNPAYVKFFRTLVLDQKQALIWMGGESVDPKELDDLIAGERREIDELEATFLAGRPLSSPHFTENGDIVQVESTVQQQEPPRQPTTEDNRTGGEKIEQAIAAYRPRPDSDGTYKRAATELAALHHMRMEYDWESIYRACGGARIDNAAAAYCTATRDVVYVNTPNTKVYPDYFKEPGYVDVIRHEIAHRRIHELCGTTSPPIAGRIYEGATNSYAVAYLGASRDELQPRDPKNVYFMTPQTDEFARKIHAGECS